MSTTPEAIPAFISRLSARLARAASRDVEREVDACLEELLGLFDLDQCGIIEVQPDVRQARLRHVAHVPDFIPASTRVEYGAAFPWTHDKTVIRGESFVQTCLDDLPDDAAVDRASSAAMAIETLVTIPVGTGGRVSHVLCLTSRRRRSDWPPPVLAALTTIAETFLAVLARHNTELALESSARGLAEAQRLAGVGNWRCDWRDDTLTASEVAQRIFGAALGGAARDIFERIHAQDLAGVRACVDRSLAEPGSTHELEYRIVRADGAVRTIKSSMQSSLTQSGTPLATLCTLQDVTDQRASEQETRRLRAQLLHVDRTAHLGALAASLSHELNQPLTGILASAQAALQRLDRGTLPRDELRGILEAIVRDDARAASVITNLRALLRREETTRVPFDLWAAVMDVLALFRAELAAQGVGVSTRASAGAIVTGDRSQIQQVFVNLLANAIAALGAPGAGERHIEVALSVRGAIAGVSVRDSGTGIAREGLARLFEPFYTTRAEGLGMGLAISRSIVEAHGGDISAHNNPAGGATFRVRLPRIASRRSGRDVSAVVLRDDGTDAEAGTRELVCVVDDDAASREGIARLLAAAGWRVKAFASGEDVLSAGAAARAHCLVVDVQMPGLSGLALHEALLRRGVDAPAVFVTARADAATAISAMKGGAHEYFTKPVDGRLLVEAVTTAVARHQRRLDALREDLALKARVDSLTPRERDVMRRVVTGLLNKQIATELGIREATVKQHRGQVMAKMGVRSVAELVRSAQRAERAQGG